MKTSFWRHWCKWLRSAKQSPILRARPRRQLLGLEALEDRVTPSLTPQLVLDINPGTASSGYSQMVAIGSTTYFAADDGVNGVELWKSDGTAAGTVLVKDITPGNVGSHPNFLTNVNGTLFFTADDGTGRELWKSDGTAAGTTLVKDIYPDYGCCPNSAGPSTLTNVNGTLFFTAYNDTTGRELWKSDGTSAGTVLVNDIHPCGFWRRYYLYPNSSYPSTLTNVNGTLFFTANNDTNGRELWKSDGTAAGTVLVKDIIPGTDSAAPGTLTN